MGSPTINDLQTLISEYENFNGAYNAAGVALQKVISTGTALYSDPTFVAQFPSSSTAYKAYLAALGQAINTFIASLPVAPSLSN